MRSPPHPAPPCKVATIGPDHPPNKIHTPLRIPPQSGYMFADGSQPILFGVFPLHLSPFQFAVSGLRGKFAKQKGSVQLTYPKRGCKPREAPWKAHSYSLILGYVLLRYVINQKVRKDAMGVFQWTPKSGLWFPFGRVIESNVIACFTLTRR